MNKSRQAKCLLLLFSVCFLIASGTVKASEPVTASHTAGTVTSYKKITWGLSTGEFYVNGIYAFCVEYNKVTPPAGTEISRISLCTNELLRKVLYYGYNGPGNVLGTDERAQVLTAIAASDANIGEKATGASAKYDAFYWDLVNNPSAYPTPPGNFKIYLATTASEQLQDLVYYEIEKNGYVTAIKTSSDSEITEGNSCYSLAGAQYGLYSQVSLAESSRVGTLTMDENGNSNTVELSAGTYYAYELVAPKGYAKSEAVTTFTVMPEQTEVLHFQDDPQTNPIEILLQKVDAETGKNIPQGFASLKGAEFTVRYYTGVWEQNTDPVILGQVPASTWVFETDEKGYVYFEESYQKAGDALCEKLPLGTLTIQETKPSPGYLLNETVFVRQITSQGIGPEVSTYVGPIVEEVYEEPDPYDLVIHKSDTYGNLLEGGAFSLYADAACEKEVSRGTTNEQGMLRLDGLEIGKIYYLKETEAPAGYQVLLDESGEGRVHEIYAVYMPATEEFTYYVDGEAHPLTKTTAEWEVDLHLTNEVGYQLPETGSHAGLFMCLTGVALCGISIYLSNKEKRRKTI